LPAIHLARLKQQSAQLVDLIAQPDRFAYELTKLFELYADRTHRPGQSGEPPSLLMTYNLPKPVLRQIINDLQRKAESNPIEILALANRLWLESFLEFRLLAASLLGLIHLERPEMLLKTIKEWCESRVDDRLMAIIMEEGMAHIYRDIPERVIEQIQTWLENNDVYYQQVGLRALISVLSIEEYENYPVFFHMLSPFIRNAPMKIRPDILEAVRILATHSPKETAYFLQLNLKAPDNPDVAPLSRKLISDFPLELQKSLRDSLRDK
jgi:hypothetical protein